MYQFDSKFHTSSTVDHEAATFLQFGVQAASDGDKQTFVRLIDAEATIN
jgi:hypothetical protein